MGRIAEISLGDILRALLRYRPVALTVAAVLVIVWTTPGPEGAAPLAAPVTTSPVQAAAGDQGGPGDAGGAAARDPGGTPAPDASAAPLPSFRPDVGPSTSPFTPAPPGGSASSPGNGVGGFAGVGDAEEDPEPLTVAGSGWASRTAGTSLVATGVPEGTLPVGNRFGAADKVAFVRLHGDEAVLTLAEDPEGTRDLSGPPAVAICKVLDPAWEESDAMAFDDAPEWDAESCVAGERSASGSWTFDLSTFLFRTDAAGFALVPGDDAPIDFQVAFTRS